MCNARRAYATVLAMLMLVAQRDLGAALLYFGTLLATGMKLRQFARRG